MPEFTARRPRRLPTHPGALLREVVLPALGITVAKAAAELGVSRQVLHGILAGRVAVSPEMAVKLGHWCGNGAEVWLGMQNAVDLWHAQAKLRDRLKAMPRHNRAA